LLRRGLQRSYTFGYVEIIPQNRTKINPHFLEIKKTVQKSSCRLLDSRLAEDIGHYVPHPIRGLPVARESSDAAQMVAQGNNRRFFHQFSLLFVDLPQPHAREKAVTKATLILRVALQATFIDKVRERSSPAALEKPARSVCGRFAEPSPLQKAKIANPTPSGENRFVRDGVVQLYHFEREPRGRKECRPHQRGVIRSLFQFI
jgi:hypothetical protein